MVIDKIALVLAIIGALNWGGIGLSKSPFIKLSKFFRPLKSSEKLMIKNERHPSLVSFVTFFPPVAQGFRDYRQPKKPFPAGNGFQLVEKVFSTS